MADLILREWNNKRIRIREDRYVSLTDMAKASGKQYKHWIRSASSKSYLETLSRSVRIRTDLLIEVVSTGLNEGRGTWGHPKVALRFAQWCSDEFAVQVDQWIDELLTTGSVSLHSGEKVYSLDMVVRRDPMEWERMFTPDWIAEAERLTGWKWTWKPMSGFIMSTVYAYLPLDVVLELRKLNPYNENGKRVFKHHQFFQPEIREIVSTHLDKVETLMKGAKGNLSLFEMLMSNHFGRYKLIESDPDQIPLFEVETRYLPRKTG